MINSKGFTLIELIIVISIISILSLVSYAPYNYYKNKAKLKNSASKITQLLYESKNKAINGSVGDEGNVSIGVFFNNSINKSKIEVFSYPYNYNRDNISYIENSDIKKIKTLILDKGIQIDSIGGYDNLLFYFDSITGKLTYYNWISGIRSTVNSNKIDIDISYKGATSRNLNKTLSYFTYTNVIDY